MGHEVDATVGPPRVRLEGERSLHDRALEPGLGRGRQRAAIAAGREQCQKAGQRRERDENGRRDAAGGKRHSRRARNVHRREPVAWGGAPLDAATRSHPRSRVT